jgi:hypothetical protein
MKDRLAVRAHGNIGKKIKARGRVTVDVELVREIRDFIVNYAEQHGEPSPGRHVSTDAVAKIFLPAAESYRFVYRNYAKSMAMKDEGRQICSENTFVNVWHKFASWIQFREPRSDLCELCQELTNSLRRRTTCTRRDKLMERFLEHKRCYEREREYYKEIIECAREMTATAATVVAATSIPKTTVDVTAHYCVDWAQATSYPHMDQQIGPLYFLSPMRVEQYGFTNTARKYQLNYLPSTRMGVSSRWQSRERREC